MTFCIIYIHQNQWIKNPDYKFKQFYINQLLDIQILFQEQLLNLVDYQDQMQKMHDKRYFHIMLILKLNNHYVMNLKNA